MVASARSVIAKGTVRAGLALLFDHPPTVTVVPTPSSFSMVSSPFWHFGHCLGEIKTQAGAFVGKYGMALSLARR